MEYFRIIKLKTTEQNIQKQLTLGNLDKISAEISIWMNLVKRQLALVGYGENLH